MVHVNNPEQQSPRAWRRLIAAATVFCITMFGATSAAVLVAYQHWQTTGEICYRRTLLALLLGLGTTSGVVLLALAWRRLSRQSRLTAATADLASVPLPPVLANCAAALGLDGHVTAFSSPVPSAFVAGLRQPHIYISTALITALDEHELRTVLRHEARHLSRRDPLRQAFAQAVQTAWPHVPGIAPLSREFRLAMELDADAAAIAAPSDRWHLASALLKVLRAASPLASKVASPAASPAAGVAGAPGAGVGSPAAAVASLGGMAAVRLDGMATASLDGMAAVRLDGMATARLDGMAAARLARLTGHPGMSTSAGPNAAASASRRQQLLATALIVGTALLWWCPAVLGPLF